MIPDPDMFTVPEPVEVVHGTHTNHNMVIRTACGLRFARRGDVDAVTCPECIRTLRAVGLIQGHSPP